MKIENKNQEIEIEKIVLNCGGTEEKLEKSVKLLEMITSRKISKRKSMKRIPTFGISPGKESGCMVTIREKDKINTLLKRFFSALDNKVSKKKVAEDHVSFGIKEYIEIPGLEYKREIGILGLEVDVVFKRKGKRVSKRKIKANPYPKKQHVTKEEIIEYLIKHYKLEMD